MVGSVKVRELAGFLAIVLVVALGVLAAPRFTFVAVVENWLRDLRVGFLTPAEPQHPEIVVVTITEETLATLPYRSPVDRGFLASLLNLLGEREVRAVGLDILFDRPTEPDKDETLKRTIRGFPAPLILAWADAGAALNETQLAYADASPALNETQLAYLRDFVGSARKGFVNLLRDSHDGTVRWVYPGPSVGDDAPLGFAPAIAAALGVTVPKEPVPLAYRGRPDAASPTFATYPALAVPVLPPAWLKGKVVLIGADLAGTDRHRTPFAAALGSREGAMPGVLIHAHALAQLLEGRRLPVTGGAAQAAIALALSALGALLVLLKIPLPGRLAGGAATLAGLWVGGFALYAQGGPLIPLLAPTLGFGAAAGIAAAFGGRRHRREKRIIRRAFSRFVAPEVVQELQKDPSRLTLGGEKRELTFVFTDIAGFTTLSERIGPEVLVQLLNDYLDGMSRIVLDHGGTIDKFVGDAVVAFFGAPGDQRDHAPRAVACAVELDAFAEDFRAAQAEHGVELGSTRIGVHSGPATVGNFGGEARFDYTAMGDTVNIASRLESVNKHLGTRVCVSEATVAQCPGWQFRPVGDLVLMGRAEATPAFEPLSPESAAAPATRAYLEAFDLLRTRDPAAATAFARLLETAAGDKLVAFHLKRLERGEEGVKIVMEEK